MAMGGVGEAMLLGAAMGGGSSALMGRDPLKGALIGGLTGGAGAGISSGISSLAGAESAALTGAGAEGALANTAATGAAGTTGATGLASLPTGVGGVNTAGQAFGSAGAATPVASAAPTSALQGAASDASFNQALANSKTPSTFSEGMAKFADDPIASIGRNKGTAFGSSIAAINATRPDPYMPEEYDGPLKRMKDRKSVV